MTAKEYAKEKGFVDAEPLIKWKGYNAYEAILNDEEDMHIGFPQIVLEKSGRCRMADYDEAMSIIDELE